MNLKDFHYKAAEGVPLNLKKNVLQLLNSLAFTTDEDDIRSEQMMMQFGTSGYSESIERMS